MSQAESTQLGRYQLVRKLATGGMAEVFLAKAVGPGGFEKSLVIKRILPSLAEDPSFVEMFLHEARLAAMLNHPNVAQIFDFGEVDGTYFLAMEFVDGPNLRTILRKAPDRRIPVNVGARLVALACEGLAYAHEFCDPQTGAPLGLIHRDVSSDNLLIARNGSVKVVDFGVAKVAGQVSNTQAGTVKGKIAYMPPEQIIGEPDLRIDVYALGVILYELAAGVRPYDQVPDVQMINNILNKDPVRLLARKPDVPLGLVAVIEKAMARNRQQRYADCRELQSALDDYLDATGERVGTVQLAQLVATTTGTASSISGTGLKPIGVPRPATSPGTGPRSGATPISQIGVVARPISQVGANPLLAQPPPPPEPAITSDPTRVLARGSAPPPPASAPRPEGAPNAVLADAEALRGYTPPAPLAPARQLEKLRYELNRDESVNLLGRFALLVPRLVAAHRDAPAILAERLAGAVTGLLLTEEYGKLGRVLEKLQASAGPADPNAQWVWEVAYLALNSTGQVQRLLERLREAAPLEPEQLTRCLRFIDPKFLPPLMHAMSALEIPESRDALQNGLAALAGANQAPFLAMLAEERPKRLADLCFLLEKGRAPDRQRAFRQVLGRRDPAQRNEVLAGMARAGSDDACNLLSQALGERTESVRLHALELLSKHFPDRVFRLIEGQLDLAALEPKSPAERLAMWRAVGSSDQPEAFYCVADVFKLKPSLLNKGKVQAYKLDGLEGLALMKGSQAIELMRSLAVDKTQPDAVCAAARRFAAAAEPAVPEAVKAAVTEAGRWERVAATSRAVVQDLMALSQAAQVLDPASIELEQAFVRLRARLTRVIGRERQFRLAINGTTLAVNNVPIGDEQGERELEAFVATLGARGIGGFAFDSAVPVEELRELVRWLTEGDAAAGLSTPHIERVRVRGEDEPPARAVAPPVGDPTREAMIRYTELITLLRTFVAEQRHNHGVKPGDPTAALGGLVDLFLTRGVRFLGLTPAQLGKDALVYHHANVAVLSLAFGVELGLPRQPLLELAEYALFHDVGMFDLTEETLLRTGDLTPADREALRKARLASAWFPFDRLGHSRRSAAWAAGVIEYGLDYGVKDATGAVQPRNEIGMVGGILSLAKTFDALTSRRSFRPAFAPDAALKTMVEQSLHRFRPDLLPLFIKFLQGQPVRPLTRPKI